jgi:hypothetical protein
MVTVITGPKCLSGDSNVSNKKEAIHTVLKSDTTEAASAEATSSAIEDGITVPLAMEAA